MIPKEKNNDKNGFSRVITVILILIVLYISYHVIIGLGDSVSTTPAGLVSESEEIVLEGIIFRDEELIYSGNGAIFPIISDGELITLGSQAAMVYPNFDNADAMRRISELENKLSVLKESKIRGIVSALEIAELEREVDLLYTELMLATSKGETHRISSLEREILIAQNKLRACKGNANDLNSQISQIEDELKRLYASFEGEAENIYAEQSGYIYYSADGYENEFTLEALDDFSPDKMKELLSQVRKNPDASDENVIRLVRGYKWYIAAMCNDEKAGMLSIGEEYQIMLFDYMPRELSATLEKISDAQDDSVVLTFSCTTLPTNFDYTRYQVLRLDVYSMEGYRVPKEALCEHLDETGNTITGVFVLDTSVVRYKRVDIISEESGYYIVSRSDDDGFLKLNDLIITDPKGMYDGKVLSR